MINLILNKFRDIINIFVVIDSRIGFKKFVKYTIFTLIVISILNIRAVATNILEFIIDISEEIHSEKLSLRDEYMEDLSPLLTELRASFGADRLLYFEFHNSESNLDGVPFKFFDLMKCNTRYGIPEVFGNSYKDIGAGMYPELFSKLNSGNTIICYGSNDTSFRESFPGVYELFNTTDKSEQLVFFGIPGIKKPIGFIVLQWKKNRPIQSIDSKKLQEFIPRINAISVARFR